MTALAPAMACLHQLSPRTTLVTLAVGALVVDWFRMSKGMEGVGYLNLILVWLFVQQLGFVYADGYFTRLSRRTLWLAMSGAYATLALLTTWGLYPVSMVGMPGEMSNMAPPSICLLVLAVAQTAMAMLVRSRVAHWLERPRLWAAVVRFASMAMTVYLWHLSLLILALMALVGGLSIDLPAAGSGLWWLTRPLWLVGLALVLSVLATLLSPFERGKAAKTTNVSWSPRTRTAAVVQTVCSGLGAVLGGFGLLGYVTSGLQPAPGVSMLLIVPENPIESTALVFAGLALSIVATRWSMRSRRGEQVRPGRHTAELPVAADQARVLGLQDAGGRRRRLTPTDPRQRQAHMPLDRDGKVRGASKKRRPAKRAR